MSDSIGSIDFSTRWSEDEELVRSLYQELRLIARAKMANEPPGHTLPATALVQEAWFRLKDKKWQSRAHFFAAAAKAMRRILIDRVRFKNALKRGKGFETVELNHQIAFTEPDETILKVDESVDILAREKPEWAAVVNLKFFVGLTETEVANILGISAKTVQRQWKMAQAWFQKSWSSPESR